MVDSHPSIGPSWAGRVALVTGAGSGIGRASARAFARAGAKVAVVDYDVEAGRATEALIRANGGDAAFIQCDVADEDSVTAMVATVVSVFGRLDAAHNNAGISPDTGTTTECPKDIWDRIMAVNLTGVWLCMKHQIPVMLETGGGAIVNTGSVSSLRPGPQIAAYTASKHALVGLTKVTALEFAAQNIRVNLVCPGMTLTPMLEKKAAEGYYDLDAAVRGLPMQRAGAPEELANAAVWLCSEQASYVTGSVVTVDGGMMLQ